MFKLKHALLIAVLLMCLMVPATHGEEKPKESEKDTQDEQGLKNYIISVVHQMKPDSTMTPPAISSSHHNLFAQNFLPVISSPNGGSALACSRTSTTSE